MYIRFPLFLRNVEDLIHERGIDVYLENSVETASIHAPAYLDEAFVKINGKQRYLWRAVDHEGKVLESVVTKVLRSRGSTAFFEEGDEAMRQSGSYRN